MAKIYIKTYGCAANQAISEILAGKLLSLGHKITSEEDADMVLLNSCVLKTPTELKILRKVKGLKEKNKKVFVIGCLSAAYSEKFEKPPVKIQKNFEKIKLGNFCPRIRQNEVIAKIPIARGCLSNCSFCAGKLANPEFFSYKPEKILDEIRKAVKDGCKEVWLSAPDTGCYGFDTKTNLVSLLEKIVKIKGDFYVRIGMMNPEHARKMLPALLEVYKNKKVYNFLHIPVQSGSDQILRFMNRPYSIREFKEVVRAFRKEIPEITISTDIICGFPGESNAQFQDSVKLIKWLRPDVLNISRFWPRSRTKAAQLPQLAGGVIKQRSRALTKAFDRISLEKSRELIGWQGPVLVDELGTKDSTFIARNSAYRPIVVKSRTNLLGEKIKVKITSAKRKYLIGKIKK